MKTAFKLAIHIGATVGSTFKSSVKSSQSQLNQLGSSIQKLRKDQQSISKFEIAESNLGKARIAYQKASREVAGLRKEIAATNKPSQKLTQSFELAKQKAARFSQKLETQKTKLRSVRRELDSAGVDTKQLSHENRKLGASIEKLSGKYRKLNQVMGAQRDIKSKRADLRGQLFDAVAIGTAVAAPLNVAINFEQSIAKLGAVTKADEASIKSLEDTARKLGETTLFTASQSAEAMSFLGMAGFKTNKILAATPGVLNLAQAAGSDLAQTADISSNILSGFSLEAEEMGRVGDVLSATFTSSNTTLQSLGETLKFVAPVAGAAGSEIEEVAAMAGLLGKVAIQGSMAGTTLRTAFLRLSAPPKMAADAITGLGLSVKDSKGNLRSFPLLLKEIGQATEDMGSAEKAEVVKKLFGSEAASGMTELLKQAKSGELDRYIKELQEAKGTTTTIAKKMGDTTLGALKRLGSALESVAISLGNVLLPTIASGAMVLASFASGVSTAAQNFPFLTKVIVGATVGLAVLKITSIAGAYAFTFLKGGVLTLVAAYRGLSAGLAIAQLGMTRLNILSALSAARMGVVTAAQWAMNVAMSANPIGLIVVGITALAGVAYLLIQHWEPIGEFFSSLWGGIQETTSSAVHWLLDNVQLLLNPFLLLGKVTGSVFSLLGGASDSSIGLLDKSGNSSALGRSISEVRSQHEQIAAVKTIQEIQESSAQMKSEHTINIDAPITIQTQPGMNEKAIAQEVQNALEQQRLRAMSDRRSNLYDEVN